MELHGTEEEDIYFRFGYTHTICYLDPFIIGLSLFMGFVDS